MVTITVVPPLRATFVRQANGGLRVDCYLDVGAAAASGDNRHVADDRDELDAQSGRKIGDTHVSDHVAP
jgi:hypothetical protein